MKRRFLFLTIAIAGGYFFLFFQLYNIQVTKGNYYTARAESQYRAAGLVAAKRGTIYFVDKNNVKLAVAIEKFFPTIFVAPKAIDDIQETYNRLLEIIPSLPVDFEKKLSDKKNSYILLQRKADQSLADKIKDQAIKGIYAADEPERYYPSGPVAAHVLGFVGPNKNDAGESGKYGLEKFYEETLNGIPGRTEDGKIIQPLNGEDLILTIDPNIQKEADIIFSNLVRSARAKGGAFIVEEPSTGKILAMGGSPSFDPNDYSQSDIGNFINPAIQKIYEPGSVMKVITMSAGIDTGKITPETTYVDKGAVTINGRRIENHDFKTHGAYGLITMTNAIEKSLNLGAIFAESKIGNEAFRNYLVKFGLQSKTGIDLPGEITGNLKPLFANYIVQVNFASASFGQGIAVTPIGLITAIGAIANGGQMMRPYINNALGPKSLGAIISSSTAKLVTQMMVSAVDKAGVARLSGYSIAGKTGTAYIPDPKTKGYSDKVTNTYVGFGPTNNPRFIILIKIEDPEGAPVAALTVVPGFRELAQFILNYYNVPPDRI